MSIQQTPLADTIPAPFKDEFEQKRIAHTSFGAGPGCMAGVHAGYRPGLTLAMGLQWIEHYRSVFRRACLVTPQGDRMWFTREGFERIERPTEPDMKPPTPGLEVDRATAARLGVDLTSIPSQTIRAYKNTEFRVFSEPNFQLIIGKQNPNIPVYDDSLVGVAFITAFNQLGEVLSYEQNQRLHESLCSTVHESGYHFKEGEGADPSEEWAPEKSLYIEGIPLTTAIQIGNQYRQNAIVWAGADQKPRLVLLR